MVYFAEASANGSVKAYFKTRRSIVVTSLATATATSTVSYEDAYKIALGIAQDVANSNAQNDANIMQVSVDTATIGETDFYLDSSLLKDFVTRDGNNYTLTRNFSVPDGLTLSIEVGERLTVAEGVRYSVGKTSRFRVSGTFSNHGTFDCAGDWRNLSRESTYNTGGIYIISDTPQNTGTVYNGYDATTTPPTYSSNATFNIGQNSSGQDVSNVTYTNAGIFYNLAILYIGPGCTFTSTATFECAYEPAGTQYFNNYVQNLGTCYFSGVINLAYYIFNCATEISTNPYGAGGSRYTTNQPCTITFDSAISTYYPTVSFVQTIMYNFTPSNGYTNSININGNNQDSTSTTGSFSVEENGGASITGYSAGTVSIPP